MNRRGFLAVLVAGWICPTLAHSPYRQWGVFRRRFLIIQTSRDDLEGDRLGEALVAELNARVPEANAMNGRSPDAGRVAELLMSGQTMLAVFSQDFALNLVQSGSVSLRVLARRSRHLLCTSETLPAEHAYRISAALAERSARPALPPPLAMHAGAAAYHDGREIPTQ